MTLENCFTISITDLKKKGFFNDTKTGSVLNWTKDSELCFCVGVEMFIGENEKYLILTHKNKNTENETENETEKYKVNIISIPSNIGKGFVTYFVCPSRGKHCRKLFSCGGKFLHREAIGLLYEQQAKKHPISYAFYLNDEQRNEPNTKNFRKYYKGKMTKRYFQILLRTSNSEVTDTYKKMLDGQRLKIENTIKYSI